MRGHDEQLVHRMSTDLTLEDLEGADEELFRLSRGLGRLRLQVGLALAALGRQHRELGFRTLDAYAKERVSRSGRWAGDLRSAAARIAALPRIFAALWSGELSWSMAELLSRHATAEDEAELLEATEGMTVRAAVEVLRERGGTEEESERLVTLQISLPSEDALLVQRARWLIEAMEGVGATGWFELLLAEGSSSLLEVAGDDPSWDLSPEDVVALQRRWLAARQQAEEERARQEERAAPHLPIGGAAPVEAGDAPEFEPLPRTIEALDERLRGLGAALDTRELFLGELAERVLGGRGWARLGYASEEQYCRERLGTSAAAVKGWMMLAREGRRLPALDAAVRGGRIGSSVAQLIARVARPSTVVAWIERARQRTYKHLREEIEVVELSARLFGRRGPLTPPDPDLLEELWRVERDMFSGASLRALIGRLADAPHAEAVVAVVSGVEAARRAGVAADDVADDAPDGADGRRLDGADGWTSRDGADDEARRTRPGEPVRPDRAELLTPPLRVTGVVPEHSRQLANGGSPDEGVRHPHADSSVPTDSSQMFGTSGDDARLALADTERPSGLALVARMLRAPRDAAEDTLVDAELGVSPRSTGASQMFGTSDDDPSAEDGCFDTIHGRVEASHSKASARLPNPTGDGLLDAVLSTIPADAPTFGEAPRSTPSAAAPPLGSSDADRLLEAWAATSGRRRRLGYATLRVRCREDVALHFRQLEVSYERAGLPGGSGGFLRFAATALFHVALPQISRERKYHDIHVRDRMCCTSPVCTSRNVTCHHVKYRAHQGDDAPENLTSPCDFCHLEGEHEGRLRILGEAPNLRWELGRTPILIVEGRERREPHA